MNASATDNSARLGEHIPVLLAETLRFLAPRPGGIYVDGTFGGGGYSLALLEAAPCTVWALDRDPAAIMRGRPMAAKFRDRLHLIEAQFGDLARVLADAGVAQVDGVAFDLGVSSYQIDEPARGFSFRADGPLDMRMEASGATAADLVNGWSEHDLADLIRVYGEERHARAIARAIVRARAAKPIRRTLELAEIVRGTVKRDASGIDPATRTFQALRIRVNRELDELESGLVAAETALRPGGRLAVVSFHSLEDRIVKDFLRRRSGGAGAPSRHAPVSGALPAPSFRLPTRRPIAPGASEIGRNPRARSARLRAGERTNAPAWPSPLARGRQARRPAEGPP